MTKKEELEKKQIDLNMLLMQVANNQGGIETQAQAMMRIKLQRDILILKEKR